MAAKTIKVQISHSGPHRLMPFNRYSLEKFAPFLVMHFGLVSSSGVLLDHYSCSISLIELDNQKKSLMDYLGKAGTLGEAPLSWQAPTGKPVELCNYLGLCGSTEIGEITLNNMVGRELAEVKGPNEIIKANTVAILRSPMELQKHWVKDLFQ